MIDNDEQALEDDNFAEEPLSPCQKKITLDSDVNLYLLKATFSSETEYATSKLELKRGDSIIAETKYGNDMLEVIGKVASGCCHQEPIEIVRLATQEDLIKEEENRYKAQEAFYLAKEKIVKHNLEMKLVKTHYLLSEPKLLFLFTADQRIDFRELVKDLVSTFHVRIELRQIGVRDETRTVGGLAICGRGYCCNTISDKLRPVSIKMVKDQNLSFNSFKISGSCGRLLCCLAYEHNFYTEQKKNLPNDRTPVKINDEIWYINEINIISKKVILIAHDGRLMSYPLDQLEKNADNRWYLNQNKQIPT